MTERTTRRQLLAIVPAVMVPFSGCVPEGGTGTHAGLSLYVSNFSQSNGTYTVNITPQISNQDDWKPFRNVSIIAKNEEGDIVCREYIGDLTKQSGYEPITFFCDTFPHTITSEIERDPCGQDTNVQKMVYDSTQDDWVPQDINCV